MPQLRLPVSGFLVNTIGSVMYGPPSSGQQCSTGISFKFTAAPLRMTSLQGPPETILGKKAPISASFGSIFNLPSSPSGMRICKYSVIRSAVSWKLSTSSAMAMRFSLAYPLMRIGTLEPLGFSNSNAGPPLLTERSANSVISRYGSTSNGIRTSSLFFSSACMKSLRSA